MQKKEISPIRDSYPNGTRTYHESNNIKYITQKYLIFIG